MYSKSKKWLSLLALALLPAAQVSATQVIEGSHAQHVQVHVSARETNRLAVEGRRIANVVPAQQGLISTKKDEAQGALYFAFEAKESAVGEAITLFVSDDHNQTYKLILAPRPIPGEEIVLRPPADRAASTTQATQADGRAASYQRRIKDMILAMADEALQTSAVEKVDVGRQIPLWEEGKLTLAARYTQAELVGEKYRLRNVSGSDMLLVEQELFRRGVRAVSVRNQTLTPGDETTIYIVRERKADE